MSGLRGALQHALRRHRVRRREINQCASGHGTVMSCAASGSKWPRPPIRRRIHFCRRIWPSVRPFDHGSAMAAAPGHRAGRGQADLQRQRRDRGGGVLRRRRRLSIRRAHRRHRIGREAKRTSRRAWHAPPPAYPHHEPLRYRSPLALGPGSGTRRSCPCGRGVGTAGSIASGGRARGRPDFRGRGASPEGVTPARGSRIRSSL